MGTLVKTTRLDARSVRAVGDIAHFRGRLLVWNTPDELGDVFEKGSIDAADGIPLLWGANSDDVIGTVKRVTPDDTGVMVDAQIVLATQRGEEALHLIRQRAIKYMAGLFSVGDARHDGAGRRISRASLGAVSLSVFEVQAGAAITHRRDAGRIFHVDLDLVADARREVAKLRRAWEA